MMENEDKEHVIVSTKSPRPARLSGLLRMLLPGQIATYADQRYQEGLKAAIEIADAEARRMASISSPTSYADGRKHAATQIARDIRALLSGDN